MSLNDIDDLATAECRREAIPFLCLYAFPICSCADKQTVLPTMEECERISTTTCRAEFTLAVVLGFDYLLPDCSQLPSKSDQSGSHCDLTIVIPNVLRSLYHKRGNFCGHNISSVKFMRE